MNLASVIVIFFISWWVIFLIALPMGVKSRWEGDDDGVDGADPGAPQDPDLGRKALRTTVAAAVTTLVISLTIVSGVFNFRE